MYNVFFVPTAALCRFYPTFRLEWNVTPRKNRTCHKIHSTVLWQETRSSLFADLFWYISNSFFPESGLTHRTMGRLDL